MSQRKVFIAIDGSKPAEAAFTWYMDNLNREGDFVYLVHSAEYKVDIGLPGAAADIEGISKAIKEEDDRINNLTGGYLELLKKRSVMGKNLTLKGKKPGEAVVEAAEQEGANIIIMGSRGLGKLRRTLLGSVSEYITHHAPSNCAVTIVRDPES